MKNISLKEIAKNLNEYEHLLNYDKWLKDNYNIDETSIEWIHFYFGCERSKYETNNQFELAMEDYLWESYLEDLRKLIVNKM